MRWPAPKIGKIRVRKKFAFLPTLLDNEQLCWLEFYIEKTIRRMVDGKPTWVVLTRG